MCLIITRLNEITLKAVNHVKTLFNNWFLLLNVCNCLDFMNRQGSPQQIARRHSILKWQIILNNWSDARN